VQYTNRADTIWPGYPYPSFSEASAWLNTVSRQGTSAEADHEGQTKRAIGLIWKGQANPGSKGILNTGIATN
jgi:hypothetical protein